MGTALLIFILALACLALFLFGLLKPKKVFLGAGGTRGKVAQVYGTGVFVLLIAAVVVAPKPEVEQPAHPEIAADTSAPAESDQLAIAPEATLALSPEEFRQRFNEAIGVMGDSYKASEFEISDGSVNNTFTQTIGPNVAMVGTVSKHDGALKELMLIIGSGNGADMTAAIATLLVAAQAANPDVQKEQIASAVMDMTQKAIENIETGGSVKRTLGKVAYSAGASKLTGLMFSISPTK